MVRNAFLNLNLALKYQILALKQIKVSLGCKMSCGAIPQNQIIFKNLMILGKKTFENLIVLQFFVRIFK